MSPGAPPWRPREKTWKQHDVRREKGENGERGCARDDSDDEFFVFTFPPIFFSPSSASSFFQPLFFSFSIFSSSSSPAAGSGAAPQETKRKETYIPPGVFGEDNDDESGEEQEREAKKRKEKKRDEGDEEEKASSAAAAAAAAAAAPPPHKPARNIDRVLAELKRKQEAREAAAAGRGRRSRSGVGELDDDGGDLDDRREQKNRDPSSSSSSSLSTNLHVSNLDPHLVDEASLLARFGAFGRVASVKIMWPFTEEERARGANSGFVAFMGRVDAERALRAGARGYVMKHEGGAMLLAAIRAVLGGKIHVSDQMSGRILETYSSPSAHIGVAGLSDREFEVLELLGGGLSTQEIGKRLSLSPKTVDSHRSNIKAKLRLEKMPELVAFAARWISSEAPAKE